MHFLIGVKHFFKLYNKMNTMCFRKSLLCCVLPIHQRSCHVKYLGQKRRRPSWKGVFSVHAIHSCILLYLCTYLLMNHCLSSIWQIIFWYYSWWSELTFSNGKEWTLDSLTFFDKWMVDMWICSLWSRQGSSLLFETTLYILLGVAAWMLMLSWHLWKLHRKSWVSSSLKLASQ
jgi:hypothetical protein